MFRIILFVLLSLINLAAKGEVTIFAVGDIMYHKAQLDSAKKDDDFDFSANFKHLEKYIKKADIALANLETTIATDSKFSGYPLFKSPPQVIESIKNAGFSILSTANNHSLDGKKEGVEKTVETIKEQGLLNIGSYKDRRSLPLIVEKGGLKLGFVAYTYGTNGIALKNEDSYMVDRLDEELIKNDFAYLKERADLIVAFIHWGNEYQKEPNNYQKSWAKFLAKNGANIIIGSHPHVVQGYEIVDGAVVFYSLGNALSNQRAITSKTKSTEDGLGVFLTIKKDEDGAKIGFEFVDFWVDKRAKEGKFVYSIMPNEDVLNGSIAGDKTEAKNSRARTYEVLGL